MVRSPRYIRDPKTNRFNGSIGLGKDNVPAVSVAPKKDSLVTVRDISTPLETLWMAFSGTPDDVQGSSIVMCSECGVSRERGIVHRCPAPNLIDLSDASQKVLQACRNAGGSPLIVGGSVRDALIERQQGAHPQSKDIDIEVYGLSGFEPLQKELKKIGRVDLTGVSFGVLKVVVDGEDFDVSLPRVDSKTGDGHTGFTTVADPTLGEVDAFSRRDFTINAMGWDPTTGELVDPWGGSSDLKAGVLRHVSDAFAEDPLRVLRAVQFAARFDLVVAEETAVLARSISNQYDDLAKERVWEEFHKLTMRGVKISRGLDVLHQVGWEQHFPELLAIRDVPQDVRWHPEGPVHVHVGLAADRAVEIAIRDGLDDEQRHLSVLVAMLHDLGKAGRGTQVEDVSNLAGNPSPKITSHGHPELGVEAATDMLTRIKAPKRVLDFVLPLINEHMSAASIGSKEPTSSAVRKLMRRLGEGPNSPTIYDWARLSEADSGGRGSGSTTGPSASWLKVAENLGSGKPRPSLLRGDHLRSTEIKAGPAWAAIIKESVLAQDEGAFNDVEGAIAWMNANAARIAATQPVVVSLSPAEKKQQLKLERQKRKLEETKRIQNSQS